MATGNKQNDSGQQYDQHQDPDQGDTTAALYAAIGVKAVQYCVPLLVVVGTFGNILTILVLLRRLRSSQANSTNFYLTVLSAADLVCIYVGLPNYFLSHVYEYNLRNQFDLFCRLQTFLVYTATHFVVWTLSVVTIDRTIWTALPYRAKEICTIRTAKIVILVLALVLCVLDNHMLWTLSVTDIGERYNMSEPLIRCVEYDMFIEFATVGVAWLDLCLLSLFPFAIQITCNCIIITKLRQYSRMRRALVAPRPSGSESHKRSSQMSSNLSCAKERSLTMMLVTTSVFFIATMLPTTVSNFYYVLSTSTLVLNEEMAAAMTLFQTFSTLLSYLNISIHFVLFCLSGKSFRTEVSVLIHQLVGRSAKRLHSSRAVKSSRSRSLCTAGNFNAITTAADTEDYLFTSQTTEANPH